MGTSIRLADATEQYERHLRARGLSERTVRNSTQVLHRGRQLWGNLMLTSITASHIDDLFMHYGWKERTRNLYLQRVNSFFKWARAHRYVPKDASPTDGWRSIRVPKVDRTRVPVEEFPDLLDAAKHPRDRAVVALGLFTFLRGSEMRTLRIDDLDLDRDTLRIYRHKTKQSDVLPVSSELHGEMVRWLNWYRADQGALRPNWYLVPAKTPNFTWYDHERKSIMVDTERPSPLRPSTILGKPYTCVQRALKALGYSTYGEGEHTLRRSGARALADTLRDRGHDSALMRVASMLGHSSTRVTEEYIGWDLEARQRNEDIAGKPMFPSLQQRHEVIELKEVAHG